MDLAQRPVAAPADLAPLVALGDRAHDCVAAAEAPDTLRAYRADWRHFAAWCARHGLSARSAQPQDLTLYLAELGDGARRARSGGD
jgi:site-specific recombinase XerD